ncbi:uncharacterized protein C10orf67 homolog, mitochondrial isoform X3 [Clupea harengus]|uniref:Uncharacterized protein C10orf67 homolog, mitochondrial isoform X3 n=1 Tax=Clupea harengus TaxID=7950 RepID=A0A8M1KBP8_CLUHA|nr:uncharacterized protein C10orf67 homolog, mitochondrial isoform X3 [Clupea harengus]
MYNNFVEADDSLFSEIQDILKGKSLENQVRVGCFKRDVSVQTDVSELPSLQTLGENNSTLRMSYAEDTGETDTDWLKDENGRLEEENEKLNDDIDSLYIDLEQLREDLEAKEKNIEALANDLKQLTIKANEERRTVQKAMHGAISPAPHI